MARPGVAEYTRYRTDWRKRISLDSIYTYKYGNCRYSCDRLGYVYVNNGFVSYFVGNNIRWIIWMRSSRRFQITYTLDSYDVICVVAEGGKRKHRWFGRRDLIFIGLSVEEILADVHQRCLEELASFWNTGKTA